MNEQELPIDIHSNKLLDWLISRRHCTREWSASMMTIREKINNAIQDMPVHEGIAKLLSGTYIHYFHCLRIVEILRETESESKNIFGRYSSQRMKDWLDIVNMYQRDNVYLAEAAQMLIRNVNYEIPSLKRQVAKLQQMQQEYERKSNDCSKNANELKEKYRSLCRQFGIKGENVREELVELMKDLPGIYSNIITKSKRLCDAKNYFSSFSQYTLRRDVDNASLLPVLSFILEKGNATVYECKYGKPPVVIEEPKVEISTTPIAKSNDDEIDFGDNDVIDFGDDQIDFGDGLEKSDGLEQGNGNDENVESGVARGNEALTILDYAETRNSFINEILELEAFLEHRIQEMSVDNDLLSMSQFQSAPSAVQLQTSESVESMLSLLRDVLKDINDVKNQQLFLIRASPKYVDRLAESLNQKLTLAEKMLQQQQIQNDKQKAAKEEEHLILPKIDLIIQRTKELHKHIETDISKRYKNRPVNLMGGINTI